MKSVIRANGSYKHYGKSGTIKTVDELSLKVYERETSRLLGPNGARLR